MNLDVYGNGTIFGKGNKKMSPVLKNMEQIQNLCKTFASKQIIK